MIPAPPPTLSPREIRIQVPAWLHAWLEEDGKNASDSARRILLLAHGGRKRPSDPAGMHRAAQEAADVAMRESGFTPPRANRGRPSSKSMLTAHAVVYVLVNSMRVRAADLAPLIGRDRTTVCYYASAATRRMRKDPLFAWVVRRIQERLGGEPAGFLPKP